MAHAHLPQPPCIRDRGTVGSIWQVERVVPVGRMLAPVELERARLLLVYAGAVEVRMTTT
jgi:hypothetical protein